MSDQEHKPLLVTQFTEEATKAFFDAFNGQMQMGYPYISVYIDSYGGSVYGLFTMIDLITAADKQGIKVITTCVGKAMSAGAVLLSCGSKDYRFIAPNAHVMIHEVSAGTWGKIDDITISVEHYEKVNKQLISILDKNSNKKAGYWKKMITNKKNGDVYLSATEAKKHGLVDNVGIPKIKTTIGISI